MAHSSNRYSCFTKGDPHPAPPKASGSPTRESRNDEVVGCSRENTRGFAETYSGSGILGPQFYGHRTQCFGLTVVSRTVRKSTRR